MNGQGREHLGLEDVSLLHKEAHHSLEPQEDQKLVRLVVIAIPYITQIDSRREAVNLLLRRLDGLSRPRLELGANQEADMLSVRVLVVGGGGCGVHFGEI